MDETYLILYMCLPFKAPDLNFTFRSYVFSFWMFWLSYVKYEIYAHEEKLEILEVRCLITSF